MQRRYDGGGSYNYIGLKSFRRRLDNNNYYRIPACIRWNTSSASTSSSGVWMLKRWGEGVPHQSTPHEKIFDHIEYFDSIIAGERCTHSNGRDGGLVLPKFC